MFMTTLLGDSPFAPQCCFIFLYTSHSSATSSFLLLSLSFGHSHFLCPSSSHLKHRGFSSITSCLLTSFTPHCIIWLLSALNLFPTAIFIFCSSPFLHFQVRCLNLPYHLHNLPFLSSNSYLSLASVHLWLSILLMRLLYWSSNIVLHFGQIVVCKKRIYLLRGSSSFSKGSQYVCWGTQIFSQVPTALLTTALIILWLSPHRRDPYTNCLFKDAAIFLCIDWS